MGKCFKSPIVLHRTAFWVKFPLPSKGAIEENMQFERNYIPIGSESAWKDMHEESAHEFQTVKSHGFLPAPVTVVLVGKSNHAGILAKGLPIKTLDKLLRKRKLLL